jgi:ankyrin repeat protein
MPYDEYRCPLTHKIMVDPVIASDGRTYEREAIEDHIKNRRKSIFTGRPLDKTLITNEDMRDIIKTFIESNQRIISPEEIYRPKGSLLLQAIVDKNPDGVRSLIETNLEYPGLLDKPLFQGKKPFHVACEFGSIEIVDILYNALAQRDQELTRQNTNKRTRSTFNILSQTISQVPPKNWNPVVLNDALTKAAQQDNKNRVKYLLSLGANADIPDDHGCTAMDYAMRNKRSYYPSLFIQHKITPLSKPTTFRSQPQPSAQTYAIAAFELTYGSVERLANLAEQQNQQIQRLLVQIKQQDERIAQLEQQLKYVDTKTSTNGQISSQSIKIMDDKIDICSEKEQAVQDDSMRIGI